MEQASVSAAWRRFSREEDEEDGGMRTLKGKGRIERVIRGSAERYANIKESAVGQWKVSYEELLYRIVLQRGYFSMGVGTFLL
ncbi:unnamed protein product [Hapterophycus canaliculatus]